MTIAEYLLLQCITLAGEKNIEFSFHFWPRDKMVYWFQASSSSGKQTMEYQGSVLTHGFALLQKFIELSSKELGDQDG